MKKLSILLAALAAMTCLSCSQDTKKYVVNGKCPEDGKKVYLYDMSLDNPIDSAVVADGAFVMKGTAAKDALMNVVPAQPASRWKYLFINDGVPVKVNLADSTLTGSKQNTSLMEYCHQINDAYDDFVAFAQNFRKLPEEERAGKRGEYRAAADKFSSTYMDLIEENKGKPIVLGLINMSGSYIPRDKFVELLDSDSTIANHPYAVARKQKIAEQEAKAKETEARKNAVIGKPFIDLKEADPKGNMRSLSEYVGKGKWVLVDFWASWCGPCKGEMPHVVAAYNKYHKKGFDIVGVSFDTDKDKWVSAISEWGMPWYHISDLQGWKNAAHDAYTVNAIPDNILVDPQGVVVARGLRGSALEEKLAEVMK